MRNHCTPKRLRELLDYEPETGAFTWRSRPIVNSRTASWNARWAGKPALTAINGRGYLNGTLDGLSGVLAHHAAWCWMKGYWPVSLDHENGLRTDNRWDNLREATSAQNGQNKCRLRDLPLGVYQMKNNRWRAQIGRQGRTHLGTFATMQEAHTARIAAEQSLGYHPNHGRK